MSERTKTSVASLVEKGKHNKADEAFLRWMDRHPSDLHVLGNYADSMMRRANHGLAIHLYRYLLREWTDMPTDAEALMWSNIGQALLLERYQEEAEYAFDKAIAIDPREPGIYNSMAACYINQGQPGKVIEWANKALEFEPGMRQALWNRSIGYLEQGDWERGWPGYLEGERKMQQRSYKEGDQMRMWDGKRNRCAVAWGEQGVGDEVMFASCLPDFIANCKHPIIDCHPRLEPIFKRNFPGVPVYGTRKTDKITWHHEHPIDSQIGFGSLPSLFRKSANAFPGTPYLKADPELVRHYLAELEKLGSGPYVGIAWFGGEKKTRFDYRSIPLSQWGPIFATGCTFTSLQYDKWGHDKEADQAGIHNFKEANSAAENFENQFALISALDLVISVCQSAVHFSGALGRSCWCLTPARPAWRYGVSGDLMAWYGKTVELIRQKEGETWAPTVDKTAQKLIDYKRRYEARTTGGLEVLQADRSSRMGGVESRAS